VNDIDARRFSAFLPTIRLFPGLAIAALAIIVGAVSWILTLFVLTWIATPIGHLMGGEGSMRDVRAALAWSMVPVIWSVIYRLPLAIIGSGEDITPRTTTRGLLTGIISHGGCSILVLYAGFQLLFAIASVILACFTVAEAQRFSTQKGFFNVGAVLALPIMIVAAWLFTIRR
jgi:hypothetical protein